MAVEARYFLGGQGFSARFADFVPRKMKYVAIIAACPSVDRHWNWRTLKRQAAVKRAQARENRGAFRFQGKGTGSGSTQTEQIQ
ncbi:MAG: hypothetical protein ACLSTW_00190 [Faecalibacterium sp.]